MAKVLHCRDVVLGSVCNYTARGDSERDVMERAAEHIHTGHQMGSMPEEMQSRAREAIHDESDDCPSCCA